MIPTADEATTGRITYRAFAGWDDLPGMAVANRAHRARIGVIESIDLTEMRHYYEHLPHTDLTRDVRIVELDGTIVGYARSAWVDRSSRVNRPMALPSSAGLPGPGAFQKGSFPCSPGAGVTIT